MSAARRHRSRAIAAAIVALLLAACGAASSTDRNQSTTTTATGTTVTTATCDGLASLCDRRLDQVMFAGTHNSFAASNEPGWYFANQHYGIARQLDDGVRALLIDVHFGIPVPDRDLVRTDFRAEGADANKVIQTVPPEARRVAERLAGPLGVNLPAGKPQLYLCHTLCELGAEPLSDELAVVDRFLKAHPRTFLMLIVEDYVPPRDIERAFEQAGLAQLAATLQLGHQLPTLGALLAQHKQLAVFSEDNGGTPAWYMPAFTFIQDTPLGARLPTQLTCGRGRGEADSPLLLINWWIPPWPPSPRLNAEIGRAAYLRAKVSACMRKRDRTGAIVAVDFYDRTSVVSVADQLNRRSLGR